MATTGLAALGVFLAWRGDLLGSIWLTANIVDTCRALRTSRRNRRAVGARTRRQAMRSALMGWIVHAAVSQVEPVISRLIGWLPFYAPVKWLICTGFLLLRVPASITIYTSLIRPTLRKHEKPIDLLLLLLHSISVLVLHFTIYLPLEQYRSAYRAIKQAIGHVCTAQNARSSIALDSGAAYPEVPAMTSTTADGDISLSTPLVPGRLVRSGTPVSPRIARYEQAVSRAEIGESSRADAESVVVNAYATAGFSNTLSGSPNGQGPRAEDLVQPSLSSAESTSGNAVTLNMRAPRRQDDLPLRTRHEVPAPSQQRLPHTAQMQRESPRKQVAPPPGVESGHERINADPPLGSPAFRPTSKPESHRTDNRSKLYPALPEHVPHSGSNMLGRPSQTMSTALPKDTGAAGSEIASTASRRGAASGSLTTAQIKRRAVKVLREAETGGQASAVQSTDPSTSTPADAPGTRSTRTTKGGDTFMSRGVDVTRPEQTSKTSSAGNGLKRNASGTVRGSILAPKSTGTTTTLTSNSGHTVPTGGSRVSESKSQIRADDNTVPSIRKETASLPARVPKRKLAETDTETNPDPPPPLPHKHFKSAITAATEKVPPPAGVRPAKRSAPARLQSRPGVSGPVGVRDGAAAKRARV